MGFPAALNGKSNSSLLPGHTAARVGAVTTARRPDRTSATAGMDCIDIQQSLNLLESLTSGASFWKMRPLFESHCKLLFRFLPIVT